MVKKVGKRAVLAYSKAKQSAMVEPMDCPKMTFKEVKRRSIISGLRVLRAPAVIALMVNALFAMDLKWGPQHELDHLELFAGDCSVSRGEFQEGRTKAVAMDVLHDPSSMDLLTPVSFVSALYHATCLKPGSGFLAAPVCSSFVYMNTGTSKRSMQQPMGQESYASVDNGNKLCARTLAIVWVVAALGCWWLVEQPQGSWMEQHPCFQHVLKALNVYRHRFTMNTYGGNSEKPTWLYSSEETISELSDFKPLHVGKVAAVPLMDRYVDASGKARIKGNSNLKKSQSYPRQFGQALAKLRSRHARRQKLRALGLIKENVRKYMKIPRNHRKDSLWVRCANLNQILEFLA